ncbi:restriction endonuclease [Noviherbaspirillum sp.]|uniref:restriction endonuclease n=1 Tax=Noviherbaspirillum sp. TaxID=1926288 RepID=UPI002D715DDB|nr:restriction endonuclease [Noviherbaspirillum sp.]HZW20995.1 restriction endonuclease [Noviherbaspirillum sp.]
MKLKMSENSLFAILLRKPWWISILIAAVVSLAASMLFPRQYAAYGASAGFPFFVIGIIAAVRQWRAPGAALVAHTRDTVAAMSWRDFADAIEAGYRRDGYEVKRRAGGADFELVRDGRKTVVSCKRWKAASTGIEALRELDAAAQDCGAHERIYMTLGQLSDNARSFAAEHRITVMREDGLAVLLRGMVRAPA